jgi:two-component system, cell cycle sensor histidine kinase and response regulator CckA
MSKTAVDPDSLLIENETLRRRVTDLELEARRTREKESLERPSARCETILREIPDIVMEVDANNVYTWANRIGLEFFGDDVIGRRASDFSVGEQDTHQKAEPLLAGDSATFCVESWQRRKDGQRRLLAWWCRALVDATGRVTGALSTARDVTESKRAEDKLRESEESYRCIFENSNVGESITQLTGEVQANRALCDLLGYSPAELRHQRWQSLTHPEDVAPTQRMLDALLAGEQDSARFTKRYLRKDGSVVWADVSTTLRRDQAGRPLCFMTMAIDITGQGRAEEALVASETRYRRLFEAAKDGILILDAATGVVVDANPFLIDLLGCPRERLLGRAIWDLGFLRDVIANQDMFLELQQQEYVRYEHLPLSAVDGRHIDVEFVSNVYLVNHEKVIQCSIRDITERTRADRELRESKQLLDSIVESVPLMLFLKEAQDLRFVVFNKAGEELLGYDRKDLLGKNNLDLFPPDQAAFFMAKDREVLAAGQPLDIPEEPILTARKGKRLLHTRKVCIKGTDGVTKYLLGISEDITEHRRAEEARRGLDAQLTQAQKMESVGRLAGGVAHDFNNALGVILGHAELAMKRLEPGNPLLEDLAAIRDAALRSANLTRQLLAFARRQAIVPKVLDLNDAVPGTLRMLRRLIGEDIELAWIPGPGLWPVRLDPAQIDQLLANLAVNSRDAIGGVGNITVETKNTTVDEARSSGLANGLPGKYVMLTVSDNGCGMPMEVLDHVFEPFFTTKAVGKGTGLGLATVYGIVHQNSGFIDVVSEPGKGTKFELYFPRVAEGVVDAGASGTVEEPQGRGETLLLVEDEAAMLDVIVDTLVDLGYSVLRAGRARDALDICRAHTGEINLVITDVIMPEMNGRDLAQRLAEIRPGIRCLFVSGYTADVIARHGVLEDGLRFLQKPFSRLALALKVRETLDE